MTDGRFIKGVDGKIYSHNGRLNLEALNRYLKEFDHLYVIARVYNSNQVIESAYLSESDDITFIPIPAYRGIIGFIRNYLKINKILSSIINKKEGAYLCRVPSLLGQIMSIRLYLIDKPYALEVVGDPYEVFAFNTIKALFFMPMKYLSYWGLKFISKKASTLLYVTKYNLQHRYPASKYVPTYSASNVDIEELYYDRKCNSREMVTLIAIGTLDQMYKGPDIAIDIVRILRGKNIQCQLVWLGDGKYKADMLNYSRCNGVENYVMFKGNLPKKEVIENLLMSDIFILPSRTEGMPRALIEAMACGLPCVATNVGGVSELLKDNMMVNKNDSIGFVNIIEKLVSNKEFYKEQSEINYGVAANYLKGKLERTRLNFYRTIKQNTLKK